MNKEMKAFQTKVVHSETKSAWNVIGVAPGRKYKIARCPYLTCNDEEITRRNRIEALEHAKFISDNFNHSYVEKTNKDL